MKSLPTHLGETLDHRTALQVTAWELITEAARDRKAAKRKRQLGIELGRLTGMSGTDIARADGTSESAIRGIERRANTGRRAS